MSTSKITDHKQKAKDRLPHQFKAKPRIEAVLDCFNEQIQSLEDVLCDLLEKRLLTNATGKQLDRYGTIVGQIRHGRNDDEYRLAIIGKIGANTCQGDAERILTLFKLMTASEVADIIYNYPAAIELWADHDITLDIDPVELYKFMRMCVGGGIALNSINYYIGDIPGEEPFAFEGDPQARGFGDFNDPAIGGLFSGAIPVPPNP